MWGQAWTIAAICVAARAVIRQKTSLSASQGLAWIEDGQMRAQLFTFD
jgi:hypothetical protein